MSNYTKATNFATKDALPAGNALKIVSGTEIDTEFSNIETAVNTKADTSAMTTADALKANTASPTFTGVPAAPTATAGTNTTQVATTAFAKAAADTKLPKSGGTMTGVIANFESTGIDDNATSTAITIDASENVGIGTSSPAYSLDIGKPSGDTSLRIKSTTAGDPEIIFDSVASNRNGIIKFLDQGNAAGLIQYSHLTDSMKFKTANSERMRIDNLGNVGIGTSSPAGKLHVKTSASGATAVAGADDLVIEHADYGGMSILSENEGHIYFGDNEDADVGRIEYQHGQNIMVFRTNAADAMRINGLGDVLVGKTTSGIANTGIELRASDDVLITGDGATLMYMNRLTSDGSIIDLRKDGTTVGSISVTGSSTSYNVNSDYRLKEDDVPLTGATERVKELRPINFAWKADGSRVDGFFAHELAEVVPEAATGTKDAMMNKEYEVTPATGDVFTAGSEAGFTEVSPAIAASPAYYDVDGNVIKAEVIAQAAVHEAYDEVAEIVHFSEVEQPETLEEGQQWRETTAQVMATRSVPDMQGIDQAKLVPLLTATMQELIARIETLEGV